MEDEVLKHANKIYHTVKDQRHTFWEKVREIIIEIFIIVFAVTLSISLHGWSEDRHEQKEVKEFLSGLKNDLTHDIDILQQNRQLMTKLDSNLRYVLSLKKGQLPDSVLGRHLEFYIPETRANTGRYEGFKSSGKIGTIEDDSLKQSILRYYQSLLPGLNYSETFINPLQLKILYLEIDKPANISLNDFVSTQKFKTLLVLCQHNIDIEAYNKAIKQAKAIIVAIDEHK